MSLLEKERLISFEIVQHAHVFLFVFFGGGGCFFPQVVPVRQCGDFCSDPKKH